jgi:hypothetical protein
MRRRTVAQAQSFPSSMPGKLKITVQIFTKNSKKIRMWEGNSLAVAAHECDPHVSGE